MQGRSGAGPVKQIQLLSKSSYSPVPRAQLEGVLPKWGGARVCDPQHSRWPDDANNLTAFGSLIVLRLTEPRSVDEEMI